VARKQTKIEMTRFITGTLHQRWINQEWWVIRHIPCMGETTNAFKMLVRIYQRKKLLTSVGLAGTVMLTRSCPAPLQLAYLPDHQI
jgi:hypothetical protein